MFSRVSVSLGKLLYYLILVAVDLSIRRKRVWGFNRLRLIFNRLIMPKCVQFMYNICTIYWLNSSRNQCVTMLKLYLLGSIAFFQFFVDFINSLVAL